MPTPDPGVIDVRSHHSARETIERLQGLIKDAGLMIFAHIDFSADALVANIAGAQGLLQKAAER